MTQSPYSGLTQLGHETRLPISPDLAVIEKVANPAAGRHYVIRFTCPEFTSLCPLTGAPDFAHLVIDYIPADWIVESKSLKLYFHAFRNEGIFFEAVTNKICDDLGHALKPRSLVIVSKWKARGGFSSVVTAEWKKKR